MSVANSTNGLIKERRSNPSSMRFGAVTLAAVAALSAPLYSRGLAGTIATASNPLRVASIPTGLSITSISCPQARHCWAVGSTWRRNFALQWRGHAWVSMSVPVPKGQARGETAMSLSCIAMNNCWAVEGTDTDVDYGDGGSIASRDVLIHWNGRTWRVVPAPNPVAKSGGYTYVNDALQSVWCAAATLCWAVGYHDSGQLALRWNGKSWRRAIVPLSTVRVPDGSTGAADLDSVFCSGVADCWAVGRRPPCKEKARACRGEVDEVLYWNGKTWTQARLPRNGRSGSNLATVACASPRECGALGPMAERNQGLHWNGRRWSIIPAASRYLMTSFFTAVMERPEPW